MEIILLVVGLPLLLYVSYQQYKSKKDERFEDREN